MAGKQIFNYSKWDNIDLSDDEKDCHPNIDKESWFRMKHRSRIEREEREAEEIKVMEKQSRQDQGRLNIVKARINGITSGEAEDAEYEDVDALEGEAGELQGQIDKRDKRIADIKEKWSWSIDKICTDKDNFSEINNSVSSSLKAADFEPTGFTANAIEVAQAEKVEKEAAQAAKAADLSSVGAKTHVAGTTSARKATVKAAIPSVGTTTTTTVVKDKAAVVEKKAGPASKDHDSLLSYNDYVIKHESTLETYSEISAMDRTKDFLFKHCDVLLHEHSQSYMLLSSLEDEMNGKHDRMKLVGRQCQILSHLQELGVSTGRDPRDVVIPFFRRIEEPEYGDAFKSAVGDFVERVQKRSIAKRAEMDKEREEEERDSAPKGPNGMSPYEVLDMLPTNLREAFEAQDTPALQQALQDMGPKEAQKWMGLCVGSGLWVPADESVFEGGDEEEEDAQVEELDEGDVVE